MRTIRKALPTDVEMIMELIAVGRKKMRASGNMEQWSNGQPTREMVENDIRCGVSYLMEENGRRIATFAFIPAPEPTYAEIYEGAWKNNESYFVIHRIASQMGYHYVFADILHWTEQFTKNMRIDTHRDNRLMQHLLEKNGFTFCGIIHLADGTERLAYQRIIEKHAETNFT